MLTPSPNAKGDLAIENVRESVKRSLERLGVERVDVLYAHAPDYVTPLEEQVDAFTEQVSLVASCFCCLRLVGLGVVPSVLDLASLFTVLSRLFFRLTSIPLYPLSVSCGFLCLSMLILILCTVPYLFSSFLPNSTLPFIVRLHYSPPQSASAHLLVTPLTPAGQTKPLRLLGRQQPPYPPPQKPSTNLQIQRRARP